GRGISTGGWAGQTAGGLCGGGRGGRAGEQSAYAPERSLAGLYGTGGVCASGGVSINPER
ncbi:hypothetical protein PH362_19155, partial [Photorhabdus bodei]